MSYGGQADADQYVQPHVHDHLHRPVRVCYNYCWDHATYDACVAKAAVLGSARSTLGLLMLAAIAAAYAQQNKMTSTFEYMEEAEEEEERKEEEKKKKTALPTPPRV